jgi:hypothetical protein
VYGFLVTKTVRLSFLQAVTPLTGENRKEVDYRIKGLGIRGTLTATSYSRG